MDPAGTLQGSRSVLPPLLISLTGIVGCSLAIIVYHMLLVRYCMADDGEENAENPTATAHDPALIIPGVEPKILETIPIVFFSRKHVTDSDLNQTECAVCLGELEEGETVRVLPVCSHIFHVPCIDHWFNAHTNCPVCRSPVVVTTDFTEESPERNIDAEDERVFEQFSPLSFHGHEHELQVDSTPASISNSTPPGVRSKIVLRHCVSLVLPRETKQKHLITGLKRSLSMDQSYVLINLTEENGKDSSSSSSMSKSNSYKARSMRQLDRMSSLLKSLSQWRIGKSTTINGILPY